MITDQTILDLTGETLVRILVHQRPRLPVILWTGHFPPPAGGAPAPRGVAAILRKPISRFELALAIQRLLTERAARSGAP